MLTIWDMAKFLAVAMIVVIGISFGYATASDKSTDTAIKEATEQTMYKSINMGCLRVDEAITIDKATARSEFSDIYKELTNYESGVTNLYIYRMEGVTPMMATEAYQLIDVPLTRAFTLLKLNEPEEEEKVRSWENRIGIFEATSTTKPPTAEFEGFTQSGSDVEDFQCYG